MFAGTKLYSCVCDILYACIKLFCSEILCTTSHLQNRFVIWIQFLSQSIQINSFRACTCTWTHVHVSMYMYIHVHVSPCLNLKGVGDWARKVRGTCEFGPCKCQYDLHTVIWYLTETNKANLVFVLVHTCTCHWFCPFFSYSAIIVQCLFIDPPLMLWVGDQGRWHFDWLWVTVCIDIKCQNDCLIDIST